MTSIERLISLLLAGELAGGRELSLEAVRRVYGRVVIQAAIEQLGGDHVLDLLDRYGLPRERLREALQPDRLLPILASPVSHDGRWESRHRSDG